jgi:Amt family ammonium transporter
MFPTSLPSVGLAFLVPLGYALIAVAGLDEGRARHAALSALAALALALLGYVAVGFALQFGGVGLAYTAPGLEGLVWEWSALGTTWGTGWGMAGLVGWGLTGPAVASAAYQLALANLPWVATAALIPLVCLRGRIPAWASGLIGLLMGALIYPLAGNWIWGGGWLANLGSNLGLGHGLVDAGGSGLVHLLGAAATLAGILVFLPRRPKAASPLGTPGAQDEPVPLPPVHLPLLAVLGCGLLLAGGLAWTIGNPFLALSPSDLPRLELNVVLAAAAGALLPLLYTWFVAGRTDPLMAVRGLAAGSVAIAAGAPFMPPWAAESGSSLY